MLKLFLSRKNWMYHAKELMAIIFVIGFLVMLGFLVRP